MKCFCCPVYLDVTSAFVEERRGGEERGERGEEENIGYGGRRVILIYRTVVCGSVRVWGEGERGPL